MAQFGKLISFIGSKRLVFRENFSHSARDKIARATGGAGHRGNGRPDWSNLRVDVEGDDFVECTVYYIQCDLCNCIMFNVCVVIQVLFFLKYLGPKTKWAVFVGFSNAGWLDGVWHSEVTDDFDWFRRLDTKTSPRGSWGSWASGRNPKFLAVQPVIVEEVSPEAFGGSMKVWVRKVHLKKGMKFNGATGIACILTDLLVDPGSRHIQMTSIVS